MRPYLYCASHLASSSAACQRFAAKWLTEGPLRRIARRHGHARLTAESKNFNSRAAPRGTPINLH